MSRITQFGILVAAALAIGCGSKPQSHTAALFGTQWELEYLSGPRIAFEALFPDKKPVLTFEQDTGLVAGNSGCNGYIAPFERNGDAIKFGEPGPSTLMYCGDGENFFRSTLQQIDAWTVDADGKLTLLFGEVPLMRFHPMSSPE